MIEEHTVNQANNNLITYFNTVKQDFCQLFQHQIHGNSIEIITPLSTTTDKFVSVFLFQKGNKIVVTDGGWIGQEVYVRLEHESKDIIELVKEQYSKYFDVKETWNNGLPYYYRSVEDIALLSSVVYDLANFIVCVVNAYSLKFIGEKESR